MTLSWTLEWFARALLLFKAQPGACDISLFLTVLEQNPDCRGHLLLQICSPLSLWLWVGAPGTSQDKNFAAERREELQPWANVTLVLPHARFASVSQCPRHTDGKSDPTYFMWETPGGTEHQEFSIVCLPGKAFLPLPQCFVLDLAEFKSCSLGCRWGTDPGVQKKPYQQEYLPCCRMLTLSYTLIISAPRFPFCGFHHPIFNLLIFTSAIQATLYKSELHGGAFCTFLSFETERLRAQSHADTFLLSHPGHLRMQRDGQGMWSDLNLSGG